jgi:hypothetical protein
LKSAGAHFRLLGAAGAHFVLGGVGEATIPLVSLHKPSFSFQG